MIEYFFNEEKLEDSYFCGKCKRKTKSLKKFYFSKMPKILVIHLKRFSFGKFKKGKINKSITFPETNLNLSKFMQSRG